MFAEGPVYVVLAVVCLLAIAGAVVAFVRQPTVRPLFLLTWGWFALVLDLLHADDAQHVDLHGGRSPALSSGCGGRRHAGRRPDGGGWAAAIPRRGVQRSSSDSTRSSRRPATWRRSIRCRNCGPRWRSRPRTSSASASATMRSSSSATTSSRSRLRPARAALVVTYYWRTNGGTHTGLEPVSAARRPPRSRRRSPRSTPFPPYGALPTRLWPRDRILVDRIELPASPGGPELRGRAPHWPLRRHHHAAHARLRPCGATSGR